MKQNVKFVIRKFFYGFLRHFLSDLWYAKIRYWLDIDEWPDLDNPQRFTEKIQCIKLFEHTNKRKMAANRLAVRSYVKEKIGAKYLVPLIGSYNSISKKDWESLPNQFVLKANHGSGMLKIVTEKNNEQFQTVKTQTQKWLNYDYYNYGREWAYKDLPKLVVAERLLLSTEHKIPKDYKFFCINGKVEVIQIDSDRFENHYQTLFDRSFNRIDGHLASQPFPGSVKKPNKIQSAIEIAEKLSEDFNFLRVDLYICKNKIYLGELTNYPLNGFIPFKPSSLEYKMGSILKL